LDDTKPILKLIDICKSFSGVQVLKSVNLDLYPGEVHCLVGENGAGKSTLIKIISGAYQPDSGTVLYQDEELKNIHPRWARENGINTIYQEIDLIPSLSVAENISLGNEVTQKGGGIDWPGTRRRAQQILEDMGGAPIDVDSTVGSLKVAYQQMVAIAKALSLNSRVLILDEPTAVFTSSEIELLFNIIARLKAQGIALLYISHHLDEIFQIGDRVTVLRDGALIRTGCIADFDKNQLIKAMVGREIDFSHENGYKISDREVLRVENLKRGTAVDEVSFTIHAGEIVGVAGLVGAGRTEMGRLLVGADTPDSGQIYLNGKEVRIKSPRHALKMGVAMLPESRKEEGLVLVRTIAENTGFSMVEERQRFSLVPWKQIHKDTQQVLKEVEIRPSQPNLQVMYLSGGNQQKVVMAKLLSANCEVLVLDEPTRGVDVGARMEIYKLIQKLKKEGKAILMISSDLVEILTQADRILVMAKGKIAGELPAREATEEKILAMALQLKEAVL
jgi:ABC-type sugar transport system ATPase subunit